MRNRRGFLKSSLACGKAGSVANSLLPRMIVGEDGNAVEKLLTLI